MLGDRRILRILGIGLLPLVVACAKLENGFDSASQSGDPVVPGWYKVDERPEVSLPSGDPISRVSWDSTTPWVLINFWASTCGPCRTEIPALNEVTDPDAIQVVGVSRDQFVKYARQFEDEVSAEFPSWMDPDGVYSEQFVKHLPRNALPASGLVYDGELVAVHLGAIESRREVLDMMGSFSEG